ncbi:MAG TPA: glycosyltransferase family 2 protein [Planctomycetota bacterium]|nr:glycosyltransferase family 2 protein [Planctomycetota bacterium]
MSERTQPLISIVIPAYNRAVKIVEALDSVQEQTYTNWEAVVVDDGSTDGTPEVVERLAASDPRIRLVRHKTNRGAQAARNTGIRASRGPWIAFLDSDDQYLANSLEIRLDTARRENVRVVYSDCYVVEPDRLPRAMKVLRLSGDIYPELLRRQGPMFQGLLVAREALEMIGGLDEKIERFQEWETSIRLARHHEFSFLPMPTFIYDCAGTDRMTKTHTKGGRAYERIVRKHFWPMVRHAGFGGLAIHAYVAGYCYWLGGGRLEALRCWTLFVFWGCLDPAWLWRKLEDLLNSDGP